VEKIVMYSAGVAYYIRRKGPGLLQVARGIIINKIKNFEARTLVELGVSDKC
jgi:hypothetical protein